MIDSATIRADFPILTTRVYGKPLVYLDNAATTHKPAAVVQAIAAFYTQSNGASHRGAHYLGERASAAYEAARESVRRFLHARDSREIVFTHGATESINCVARSFCDGLVRAGDEILISEMEHHSNLVPWQMCCQRTGAVLKVIPFDAAGALKMEMLDSLVTEKTRLLALTHVSNVLGVVNPVREIVAYSHARGIPVLVDGAQAVAHIPVDVQELDCDFYVFSGHKMYAATGIGVLYGKERWLDRMPPYQAGGGMIASVDFGTTTYAEPPLKFEAGTPNIAGAISLHAAIDYVNETGRQDIYAHEQRLVRYATGVIGGLATVTLYGTAEPKVGVFSFNLGEESAYDIAMLLDKQGIAVRSGMHCAEPVMRHFGINGSLRASFAMYTTSAEIDSLAHGLEKARGMLD